MDEIRLVDLAQTFADEQGISLSRAGALAASDGKFFRRLSDGRTCTVRLANSVIQWFSDHWPADLPWPDGVDRPSPSPESPAAGLIEAHHSGEYPCEGRTSSGGGDPSGGRRGTPSLPSPSLPAAGADSKHEHPMKRVKAALDRRHAALTADPPDWEAAAVAAADAIWAGAALRRDGRLASPDALCLALGLDREVYDYCRDRRRDEAWLPRRGMPAETMLAALGASGDVRFASLPAARAALRALAQRGDVRFAERSAA